MSNPPALSSFGCVVIGQRRGCGLKLSNRGRDSLDFHARSGRIAAVLTFILATRNRHKVQEIRSALSSEFNYLTLEDFPSAPEVVEDADTFIGNAEKKALELARWLGRSPQFLTMILRQNERPSIPREAAAEVWCLADDSGLEVDALEGAPGVYSARFAALDNKNSRNSPDEQNNTKLLRLLASVPADRRTARFRCAVAAAPIVFAAPDASVCYADESDLRTETFTGTCEGRILTGPRGDRGFGYDPLFVPEGFDQTFAELSEDVKNQISHRAKALQQLHGSFNGR